MRGRFVLAARLIVLLVRHGRRWQVPLSGRDQCMRWSEVRSAKAGEIGRLDFWCTLGFCYVNC